MGDLVSPDFSELAFLKKRVAELETHEMQLRAECEHLKLFYEHAPLSYQSLDEDGCFIEVNQAWLDTLGYTRDEVIGRNFSEFLHPDWQDHFKENFPKFKAIGEILGIEFEMVRKDGRSILVSFNGKIGKDSLGCFQQTYCIFQNITDRKRAEDTLLENEARMRAITDSARDAIIMMDQNGTISYWNPAAQRIFGYTADEAIGTDLHQLLTPLRYHKAQNDAFPKFKLTGRGQIIDTTVEVEARHKNGQEFSIELSLSALFLQDHWHALGVIRDISERKRIEEALREGEKKYRIIFDSANDALFIHNMQGRILETNPMACERLGYDHAELTSMKISQVDTPGAAQRIPEHLAKLMEQGHLTFEVVHLRKDGLRIPTEVSARRIEWDGQLAIMSICRDISERKRAEEEKERLQTQLIHTQKMEAIGTLAGGIAHDFNNILGAILGYAELARNACPSGSRAIKFIDRELDAVQRATLLVKQILAFSRQEKHERIPLHLDSLIKEAVKLLRPILPSTISIKQQVDTTTKSILADPTQAHQILMNLCTNAFHAMEKTGGTLEITLKNSELSRTDLPPLTGAQPGTYVVLSVGDTGTGIPQEIREKIFDPYFSTKGVGKGSGMGLAITHGIITRYGGFINVESNPGAGSIFHVFFPAIEHEALPEIQNVQTASVGNARILLVDDEDMLLELGKEILESLGYEVTVRKSSREALVTFKNQPDLFDVVITDQTMPEMTGIDLAREILEIRADIPIILCTGYSSLVNEKEARTCGIKEFVMKPVTIAGMATLLKKVLNQEKSGSQMN
jgi:PAS domain S-box-containing protein